MINFLNAKLNTKFSHAKPNLNTLHFCGDLKSAKCPKIPLSDVDAFNKTKSNFKALRKVGTFLADDEARYTGSLGRK